MLMSQFNISSVMHADTEQEFLGLSLFVSSIPQKQNHLCQNCRRALKAQSNTILNENMYCEAHCLLHNTTEAEPCINEKN